MVGILELKYEGNSLQEVPGGAVEPSTGLPKSLSTKNLQLTTSGGSSLGLLPSYVSRPLTQKWSCPGYHVAALTTPPTHIYLRSFVPKKFEYVWIKKSSQAMNITEG